MPTKIFDWFIDCQLKFMALIGVTCILTAIALQGPYQTIVFGTIFCFILALAGSLLYQGETSESWLDYAWTRMIKDVIGLVLIGSAWLAFAGGRGGGVIGQTIAIVILKLS